VKKGKATTKQVIDRLKPVGIERHKSVKVSLEETRKILDKLHASVLQSNQGK